MSRFWDSIKSIPGIEVHRHTDLSKFTTIRLQAIGSIIIVKNLQALGEVVVTAKANNESLHLVGWGANQVLFGDRTYLKLDFPKNQTVLDRVRECYDLDASVGLNRLVSHAKKFGLRGWEALTGIPASLGGAIAMNAGTRHGEIAPLVKSVKIMNDSGEIREHMITDQDFSYRQNCFLAPGDIIIAAKLVHFGQDPKVTNFIKEYEKKRLHTQPITKKTCGCVFKNPTPNIPAGMAIELLGLSGLSYSNLEISAKHANFVENQAGTVESFSKMVEQTRSMLEVFYGEKFEFEVKLN